MPKNRRAARQLIIALVTATTLTSCYSSQQLVQPSLSKRVSQDPTFLDGVTLGGNKTHGMTLASKDICLENISGPVKGNTLKSRFACLLNVLPQTITNLSLYRFIDEWYGTHYRLGGMSREGIDCSAFVQKVYEHVFGINLMRTAVEQYQNCKSIADVTSLKEGDLVFFHIKGSQISHVGMYLMNHFFVHASSSKGVMISSLDDKYWQKYYAGAGRLL